MAHNLPLMSLLSSHNHTGSPKYPQANGEAERAVKTFKDLWKKNNDPYLALLVHRSTPLQNGLTPSEMLMGRLLKNPLPVLPQKLTPTITKDDLNAAVDKDEITRTNHKQWYAELQPGSHVWIRDQDRDGVVLGQHSNPRSYIVRTQEGTVRRNRSALVNNSPPQEPETVPSPSKQVHVPSPHNVVHTPEGPMTMMTRSRAGKAIIPPKRLDM